jgi:hypothetical protein
MALDTAPPLGVTVTEKSSVWQYQIGTVTADAEDSMT